MIQQMMEKPSSSSGNRKIVRQETPPKSKGPVKEDYGKYEAPLKPVDSKDSIKYSQRQQQKNTATPLKNEDDPYFTETPAALQNTMDDQEIANIAGSINTLSGNQKSSIAAHSRSSKKKKSVRMQVPNEQILTELGMAPGEEEEGEEEEDNTFEDQVTSHVLIQGESIANEKLSVARSH